MPPIMNMRMLHPSFQILNLSPFVKINQNRELCRIIYRITFLVGNIFVVRSHNQRGKMSRPNHHPGQTITLCTWLENNIEDILVSSYQYYQRLIRELFNIFFC